MPLGLPGPNPWPASVSPTIPPFVVGRCAWPTLSSMSVCGSRSSTVGAFCYKGLSCRMLRFFSSDISHGMCLQVRSPFGWESQKKKFLPDWTLGSEGQETFHMVVTAPHLQGLMSCHDTLPRLALADVQSAESGILRSIQTPLTKNHKTAFTPTFSPADTRACAATFPCYPNL